MGREVAIVVVVVGERARSQDGGMSCRLWFRNWGKGDEDTIIRNTEHKGERALGEAYV